MAFFGFETVEDWVKTQRVKELFGRVTNSYDLMNDVMSLGVHRCWKDTFVSRMDLQPNNVILDVASGTGDITQRIFKKYRFLSPHVMALDLTESMLMAGKERAINRGMTEGIEYIVADAEELPLEDSSIDVYTCAYGFRNVGNLEKALREAHRVLKNGGRFYCLEFSPLDDGHLKPFYDFYSFHVIPAFGKYIAKDEAAYQYLAESIRKFPPPKDFKTMLETVGFMDVGYTNLACGITAIHQGKK